MEAKAVHATRAAAAGRVDLQPAQRRPFINLSTTLVCKTTTFGQQAGTPSGLTLLVVFIMLNKPATGRVTPTLYNELFKNLVQNLLTFYKTSVTTPHAWVRK